MKPTIVPFVKWVGGKRQLMDELMNIFSKFEYKNYHEPFVGGGSVFIELLSQGKTIGSINDLNEELINVYKMVKDKPELLIKQLKDLEENHSRFQYYSVRKIDKDLTAYLKYKDYEKAARFIYLNKTGFNGIYRVNSKNEFNVPLGNPWRVNLNIFSEENIMNLSKKFNESNMQIFNKSYEYILDVAQEGDLVYLDPPYDSFEEEVNFVGYQKEGFTREDQEKLRDVCDKLIAKGVYVAISNHNTEFIKKIYSKNKYYIHQVVSANRSVNRDSSNRGKKEIEVIIYGKN